MKRDATHESSGGEAPDRRVDPIPVAPAIPPFGQALPTKLLRAREAALSVFRPILHARHITDQQWRIVRALAELDEAEILALSECCCIHPASLSRILPKMEAAGLINRRVNMADKRRVIVSLADKGRRLFDDVAPDAELAYEALAQALGAEQLEKINRVLDEFVDTLTKPAGGRHV